MTESAAMLNPGGYTIRRRNRFWEVLDSSGDLVCLTVYKRGAKEVVHRLFTAKAYTASATEGAAQAGLTPDRARRLHSAI